jgi:NAD-dependent deacetylase
MQQARDWLRGATSVAVLTGSGISAESGIPTFRGPGGLWKQFRPEQLATPDAFARDPRLVWEWYDWRRNRIAQAAPNAGHLALAELERHAKEFCLITQNVDDLHERAGNPSVLRLHGDIWTVRCTSCLREEKDTRPSLPDLPPHCSCGGLLRPGVVWFGEALPADVWERAAQASSKADVFLVVGTSGVVYPAAGLIATAKSAGARIIEVNTEDTAQTSMVDCVLRGPAAELLPQLVA